MVRCPSSPRRACQITSSTADDVRDVLLRMGRLPEAYIATPHERELRELVRHRAKLVALRSGLKAQVQGVFTKQGQLPAVSDVFGPTGDPPRRFPSPNS